MTVKSVYDNQDDILAAIMALNGIAVFDVDVTYGNGAFYKRIPQPIRRFDIDGSLLHVEQACSTSLPLSDASVRSLVFDPPFLTYVRDGRTGNGTMALAKRFGGYWRYEELRTHYMRTLIEAYRVLQHRGIMVFKCQDITHNHRFHATHINVMQWAAGMFRLKDLFILIAGHRMPSPNREGMQKHARIHHSYFLVLERER